MAAIVREGSRHAAARPRPKAPARLQATRPRTAARSGSYAPAKLRAAQGLGLKPLTALVISAAVLAGVVGAAFSSRDHLDRASGALMHAAGSQLAFAGFRLASVHVRGATPEAAADILKATGLKRNEAILAIDLPALRQRLQHVGWVKDAKVVRLLPDTLVISVIERPHAAVWQYNGRLMVIDDQGQPIREADASRFSSLPLVVGEGAAASAASILPLVRARPRLMQKLEALVRVDDRRWDVRLKDGGLIQLPADGEESALIQLDQLDEKERVLDLGFERIDLRDPELVAVRPRGPALAAPAPATAGV